MAAPNDNATRDDDLCSRIHARVVDLTLRAQPLCSPRRVEPPRPVLRYDLRGQAAGQARWYPDHTELRFNLGLARHQPARFIIQTVTHEYAHLLTLLLYGRVKPHGQEWRDVMGYFGIADPQRCHDYPIGNGNVRRQRRWEYACGCASHALTTTRHHRVQTGRARYVCRRCGEVLRHIAATATGPADP